MAIKAVSVLQLNTYINRILSTDPVLLNVSVIGEISNLTKHSSGHWYFSLKDNSSSIRCFLPKDRIRNLRYDIEEGMQIIAHGYISVYEKGGNYSLNIKDIDIEGEGDLKKAFELLVKKLDKEGLFNKEHKKEIPSFPKRIGVITSPTGAAIRDIISTIKRRNPMVDILIYPCLVQGSNAAQSIIQGIKILNTKFKDLDLIILGRGGGSAEDLWTFNEESLAREIFASEIPIISAVGHEIDYVISDYVADLRAATPTAAAELAVPDISYYKDIIDHCEPSKMYKALNDQVLYYQNHIKSIIINSNILIETNFKEQELKLNLIKSQIDALNPYLQLEKGYAIIKSKTDNWVNSESQIEIGENIKILLKDGDIECLVLNKQLKN